MRCPFVLNAIIAVAVTTCGIAQEPASSPRYYMILFGSDAGRLRLAKTHTWATYVRATPQTDGSTRIEEVTLSWLPADGRINPLRPFRAERGTNPGLHGTLRYAMANGERVAMWGPYETDACRYELAVRQAGVLASGTVAYRAVDSFARRPDLAHCVHAVTRADPVIGGRRQPVLRIGRWGTAQLAQQYAQAGAFVQPAVTHDWLIPVLGLDRYPLDRAR